jgi:thiol-disulfide isomerase/thioredoxin
MKKIIQHTLLMLLLLTLWDCQPLLKVPAAAIMSTTLPTPQIDSTKSNNNLPAADFSLRVKDLDGKLVSMEDYRGKVIFLNFWATWCMPCVAELPSIDKLHKKFKDENIVFLLISNEQTEKVTRYRSKKNYEIPFYIIDEDGFIPQQYFSQSIPTTFIINKEGRILKVSTGAEDWDDDKFVKELKKLL